VGHSSGKPPHRLHLLHLAEVLFYPAAVADVMKGAHRCDDVPAGVENRCGIDAQDGVNAVVPDHFNFFAAHRFAVDCAGERPMVRFVGLAVAVKPGKSRLSGEFSGQLLRAPSELSHGSIAEGDPARRGLGQNHAHRNVVQHRRQSRPLSLQLGPGGTLRLSQSRVLRDQPGLADFLGQPGDLDGGGRLIGDGGEHHLVFVFPGLFSWASYCQEGGDFALHDQRDGHEGTLG